MSAKRPFRCAGRAVLMQGLMPGVITVSAAVLSSSTAFAQTPAGWISNDHTSAYTLAPGSFELTGSLLKVDDSIDFLDLRDDLLSSNTRLIDNSGDLDGSRGELRVGVWRGLELFYRRQDQDMTLKLNQPARADIVGMDQELQTRSSSYGLNWVFYEAAPGNRNSPWRSASLELSRIDNESKDFGGRLERVRLNANTSVSFDPPQRFALDRLQDEGWQARLIYTMPIRNNTAMSVWAAYGQLDSSSGTSTEIDLPSVAQAFEQRFDAEETLFKLGVSFNWQHFPRLPVQFGYEYINVQDRKQTILSSNSTLLPSFLRGTNLGKSESTNHTAYASASWWVTPNVYLGLSGKLFKHQFVGVMPHYNNPLSSSFSDTLYGYAEFRLGLKFGI